MISLRKMCQLILTISGSAVSVFAALLHPMASTLQSTKRAAQSAKSVPVSSFLSVLIFFPPFGIITAEFCTDAHAVNRRRQTALCLICLVLIRKQGDPPALRPPFSLVVRLLCCFHIDHASKANRPFVYD